MAWVLNRDLPMESIRISYKRHENFGEQSNGGKNLSEMRKTTKGATHTKRTGN
jgi:hypothetical protein